MRKLFSLNDYGMGLPGFYDFLNQDDEEARAERKRKAAGQLKQVIENELTNRQREIITLYYFQGKTIIEIAGKLDINKSSVSRTLGRARKRIARSMKYGFERF